MWLTSRNRDRIHLLLLLRTTHTNTNIHRPRLASWITNTIHPLFPPSYIRHTRSCIATTFRAEPTLATCSSARRILTISVPILAARLRPLRPSASQAALVRHLRHNICSRPLHTHLTLAVAALSRRSRINSTVAPSAADRPLRPIRPKMVPVMAAAVLCTSTMWRKCSHRPTLTCMRTDRRQTAAHRLPERRTQFRPPLLHRQQALLRLNRTAQCTVPQLQLPLLRIHLPLHL